MWLSTLKYLAWVGQLGLSLAVPPVLAVWCAGWLRDRFGLGGWVSAVGLALGLLCSVWSLFRFLKMVQHEAERGDRHEG